MKEDRYRPRLPTKCQTGDPQDTTSGLRREGLTEREGESVMTRFMTKLNPTVSNPHPIKIREVKFFLPGEDTFPFLPSQHSFHNSSLVFRNRQVSDARTRSGSPYPK